MTAPHSTAPHFQAREERHLLDRLRQTQAVILSDGPPPWRAVPRGDARCKPVGWVEGATLGSWRAQGLVGRHKKGWTVLGRPAPAPILTETPDGGVEPVMVRENRMQRLARDLDLDGPLAEAGHRLVADGLRAQAGTGGGGVGVRIDGGPRTSHAAEARIIHRLDARRRVRRALDGLGELEREVAEAVCLHDRALESVCAARGVAEAEAAQAFTLAMLKLSRFYGTMPGWNSR